MAGYCVSIATAPEVNPHAAAKHQPAPLQAVKEHGANKDYDCD
jgi:hypothetical protein